MDLRKDGIFSPPPQGFRRKGDGAIIREVRGDDGFTRFAAISDEGEAGFSLAHTSTWGTTSVHKYSGLTFDEALKKARQSFRKVGADDGLRWSLPEAQLLESAGVREGTRCAECVDDGRCWGFHPPAYSALDGENCV